MNRVLMCAALVAAVGLPLAAQAEVYDDGLLAMQQGDTDRAVETWTALAEQGDAESQVTLAFLYDTAQGVPGDLSQARHWYQKAAAQGNVIAEVNLAMMYELGDGVGQDLDKARQFYREAAKRGDSQSIKWLIAAGER